MAAMPGDGAGPRELRRLRSGDEGLRSPARHRGGERFRGARARRPRVVRRACRRTARPVAPTRLAVIVQDPCHLRHVQRAHESVRTVLGRYADIVELDDDGLCCGAGGAYSALQPELAASIRDRKLAAIDRARRRTGATVVASANPGCAMHLAVGRSRHRRARRPPPRRHRRRGRRSRHVMTRYQVLADRLRDIVDELDERVVRAAPRGGRRRRHETPRRRQGHHPGPPRRREGRCAPRPSQCDSGQVSPPDESAAVERVERVDHRAQVAVAVLGELEADARQVDAVVLADLDAERRRRLDPAVGHEVARTVRSARRAARSSARCAAG